MESEKINVVCAECDNSDYDTKENLESAGWKITEDYELCSLCRID